jgi:hypothetical protein
MAWKQGPLPADTWGWGGVTLKDTGMGFYFADFKGDHVTICPGERDVKADEVVMYDNSLTLPPNAHGRAPGS